MRERRLSAWQSRASPPHVAKTGAWKGISFASFRRFWAVAANRNSSLAPLGPRRRNRSSRCAEHIAARRTPHAKFGAEQALIGEAVANTLGSLRANSTLKAGSLSKPTVRLLSSGATRGHRVFVLRSDRGTIDRMGNEKMVLIIDREGPEAVHRRGLIPGKVSVQRMATSPTIRAATAMFALAAKN